MFVVDTPLASPKKVDSVKLLDLVAQQMEISAEFSDGFLCGRTGKAFRLHEYNLDPVAENLIQSGQLQMIPSITSQDLYLWMCDFALFVHSPNLRGELQASLKGISAVWKFRNVLYKNEDLSKDWEQFKSKKLRVLAEDWLSEIRDRRK